jgi:hypothetical protein
MHATRSTTPSYINLSDTVEQHQVHVLADIDHTIYGLALQTLAAAAHALAS